MPQGFTVLDNSFIETNPDALTWWDGIQEWPVSQAVVLPYGYKSVEDMKANAPFYVAHRLGSLNLPEHSAYAASRSLYNQYRALEFSMSRTVDGHWFGLHDINLRRTSENPALPADAATMTKAQVQAQNITLNAGGTPRPYLWWDELVELYGYSHTLFLDLKHQIGGFRTEFLSMVKADVGVENAVIKYYGDATGLTNAAKALGFQTWGYFYGADITSGVMAAKHADWSMLGMDVLASAGEWSTTMTMAAGRPVLAHGVKTEAHVATALSRGASGFMVEGTLAVAP